ncbi:MAG: hypothetical protein RhofKO_43050 [Rhodothermales bacterium]
MIALSRPYRTRSIRFLHIAEHEGWRIKVYGIRFEASDGSDTPDPEIVALAEQAALPHLPQPAQTESRYGIGFLIVHQGQDRNWLLLDWWYDLEIIKQRLFSSPLDAPSQITPAEPDLLACTWELAVHGFERQAWIDTVLTHPDGPDVQAYLNRHLNAEV